MNPWKAIGPKKALAVASVISLMACGTIYREPNAVGLATSEVARLSWDLGVTVKSIDGYTETFNIGTYYGGASRAELAPGEHSITFVYGIDRTWYRGTAVIDMKAGHSYRLKNESCFWCSPRKAWFWIEDQTTGDIIYGRPSSSKDRSPFAIL